MHYSGTSKHFFNELATLCDAGLSVIEAAKKVLTYQTNKAAWVKVIQDLQSGKALNKALADNQFINQYEQTLLSVAETSGHLVEGLKTIGNHYAKRQTRVKGLKIRLYLPFIVIIIAVIASSILSLIQAPQESVSHIILNACFWIAISLLSTRLLLKLMLMDASSWLRLMSCFKNTHWYTMQSQYIIFSAILWQIKAGIDFKSAFDKTAKIIKGTRLTQKLKQTSYYCGQGMSVSKSIHKAALPITDDFAQLLLTAEQSGKWHETVERYLKLQEVELDNKIETVFNMSPRLYYLVVTLVVLNVVF
jgi:type II secretory pathway component PulF